MVDFAENAPPSVQTSEHVIWGISGLGLPFLWHPGLGRVMLYRNNHAIVCILGEVCVQSGVVGELAGILDISSGPSLPKICQALAWLEGAELALGEKLN